MRDAVTRLIQRYDLAGRYLDRDAIDFLKAYFTSGERRIQAVKVISVDAVEIVKSGAAKMFTDVPDLLRPGGNAYTTRRYATCLRDLDYYLRYATYALVAGDPSVLDDRVLAGLRETYNSLGVPIGPTIIGIQGMKTVVLDKLDNLPEFAFVAEPFDHMARQLAETDV